MGSARVPLLPNPPCPLPSSSTHSTETAVALLSSSNAFFSLVLVRGFAGVEDWMRRVHPIYPSFSLVMTKSGLLARDPSRLPSYRSCTHRYHPYTMAGRASRDEDTCMVRALTRPSSLLADENQRSAFWQNLTGGTGGAEHFIEEPELVRLVSCPQLHSSSFSTAYLVNVVHHSFHHS